MGERNGLVGAVFGVFAVLGALTAAIAFAVTTQVDGGERSAFKAVAIIASVLTVLTGYLALAAWRRWWPLRELTAAGDGSAPPA